MKVTRNQLRQLIETTIKPSIPNIPSGEAYTKIDDLARQEEFQPSADSVAGAFGYPEDRSYSEDLRTYDQANMPTLETVSVYRHPNLEIAIPRELVDDVIDAHQAIARQPGGQIFLEAQVAPEQYFVKQVLEFSITLKMKLRGFMEVIRTCMSMV